VQESPPGRLGDFQRVGRQTLPELDDALPPEKLAKYQDVFRKEGRNASQEIVQESPPGRLGDFQRVGRQTLIELDDALPPEKLAKYQAHCHNLTFCGCIRKSGSRYEPMKHCGWCADTSSGMVGNAKGPHASEGTCSRWIWRPTDCETLWCPAYHNQYFFMQASLPVMLCVALTITVYLIPFPDQPYTLSEETKCVRTQAEFNKGLWGVRTKHKFVGAYANSVPETNSLFQTLWALMQSTSVKKSYCSICTQVTLVCITRTIFKLSPLWLTQLGFQEIHVLTSQTARVADQLRGLTSFVFGFYLIGRIGWWWDVMACGKAVQASIHDIAMLVGAIVHEEGDEWLELKFDLLRYLCCLLVFSFPRTDNKMALLTDDMLMELGFLKEKEVELLLSSFYPRQMIVKWTTCWSSKYIHNVMERQLVMQKVSERRRGGWPPLGARAGGNGAAGRIGRRVRGRH